MSYGEALSQWANRVRQEGYFEDVFDHDQAIEINGTELMFYVEEAVLAWKAESSPVGLDYRG